MFDLTSAKDGNDPRTPVILQCTLPFLNLLQIDDDNVADEEEAAVDDHDD